MQVAFFCKLYFFFDTVCGFMESVLARIYGLLIDSSNIQRFFFTRSLPENKALLPYLSAVVLSTGKSEYDK